MFGGDTLPFCAFLEVLILSYSAIGACHFATPLWLCDLGHESKSSQSEKFFQTTSSRPQGLFKAWHVPRVRSEPSPNFPAKAISKD